LLNNLSFLHHRKNSEMKKPKKIIFVATALILAYLGSAVVAEITTNDSMRFGLKIRVGGRYDDVRKCVASKTGTKGGIAADISAIADIPTGRGALVQIDLPVMRPILFAAAFDMLQFEPTVTLKFSDKSSNTVGWVAGPMLGVSLHYGPDYNSEAKGVGRTSSFFAMGPIIGGYAGLDFRRSGGEVRKFQLGISPYVIPLFGIGDPKDHRGVVAGALVDGTFRFGGNKK
jgi:hypothetical protein